MRSSDVVRAWKMILAGRAPSLSIEITRECPLRCPGCYAYEDNHLGGTETLRTLSDFKGEALIQGVLEVVDRYKPLHLSIVGGDPLVRYRELEVLAPLLIDRGIHVQVVTSAFRRIPAGWGSLEHMNVSVSIDGLQPEHDVRRKPATYDRILKSIHGEKITVHCTVTAQMVDRPGYLEEFVRFWAAQPEVEKIWFSLFTPQIGADLPEILSPAQRVKVVHELMELRERYSKLDLPRSVLQQFLKPPSSPDECIFAQTTETISADLKTRITPCQFGGEPDCSQCGCVASMGLAAIGDYKLAGFIPVGKIFTASNAIGKALARRRAKNEPPVPPPTRPSELVTLSASAPERVPATTGKQ
ncbi:MAG TPA: radical SAM protein [Bryobacteraceae bacterium]|nr:radical SAM protein [Bryobacteraceae bacterium]